MTAPRPCGCAPATLVRRWPSCSRATGSTSSSRAGPTLAAAFLRAGLVDEVVAYVAPMLLGAGLSAVGDLGIATIGRRCPFRRHAR